MTAPECGCYECDDARRRARHLESGDWSILLCRFMIVCPGCGNKRCPKATQHDNPCTGSNAPNQPGSRYQYPPIEATS
jgi:hypothetical protein